MYFHHSNTFNGFPWQSITLFLIKTLKTFLCLPPFISHPSFLFCTPGHTRFLSVPATWHVLFCLLWTFVIAIPSARSALPPAWLLLISRGISSVLPGWRDLFGSPLKSAPTVSSSLSQCAAYFCHSTHRMKMILPSLICFSPPLEWKLIEASAFSGLFRIIKSLVPKTVSTHSSHVINMCWIHRHFSNHITTRVKAHLT